MLRTEGKYLMGTIKEVVEYLLSENNTIPDFDFSVIEDNFTEEPLENLAYDRESWYGLHNINTGFDSDGSEIINLFTDWYGGGCGNYTSYFIDDDRKDVIEYIAKTIYNTLSSGLIFAEVIEQPPIDSKTVDKKAADEYLADLFTNESFSADGMFENLADTYSNVTNEEKFLIDRIVHQITGKKLTEIAENIRIKEEK